MGSRGGIGAFGAVRKLAHLANEAGFGCERLAIAVIAIAGAGRAGARVARALRGGFAFGGLRLAFCVRFHSC